MRCLKIWLDVQNEVIKPAINGVLDIMKACLKAKTVRRLVFTSSAGTLNVSVQQKHVLDETCWSDVEFCQRVKMTAWVSIFIFLIESLPCFTNDDKNFSFCIFTSDNVLCFLFIEIKVNGYLCTLNLNFFWSLFYFSFVRSTNLW